ncbi:NAD(P)-binding protein [Auricularia subglabra TFB-10046 SS5]|nr:NAD(P)-binding protein [Auricularia subglabra TFB-10046 SS5]
MNASWGWETTGDEVVSALADRVKGRIFLITGPSPNGLAAATAIALANAQPEVIVLAGRTPAKFQPVCDAILAASPGTKVVTVQLDLSSFASVRAAAAEILTNDEIPHIDVLINNAGVLATPFGKTVDGIEQQFATNHLGHFLLTSLLLLKLKDRVISIASSGHRLGEPEFLEDYNYNWETRKYNAWLAYGQSKLANVLFANEIARRYGSTGLKAYSLHPGDIMTELLRHIDEERNKEREELYPRVLADPDWETIKMKTLDNGCSTILVAALAPESDLPNGSYLANCQIGSPKATTRDVDAAKKLWELSERLVGQKFGETKA